MTWRPLPHIAFAVCTYPFQPESTSDLPLQIGDDLYIIEEGGRGGEWLRGYLVAAPSLLAGLTTSRGQPLEARVFAGIFPRACVEIKEEIDNYAQPGQRATNRSSAVTAESARISGEWPTPPRGNPPQARAGSQEQTDDSDGPRLSQEYEFPVPPTSGRPTQDASSGKPAAPVPMLKIGDETAASRREPLIDEVASALREWHSTNLHELLLSQEYTGLENMSQIVSRVDTARRQLFHRILTDHELSSVRESAIWDLVRGNRMLSGEVIVRSLASRGRMLTFDDSPLEISSLQATMSLLDEQPTPAPDTKSLHHVLLKLRQITIKTGKDMTLVISLCARDDDGKVHNISEAFTLDAPAEKEQPTDDEPLENPEWRTLFTDMSSAEIQKGPGQRHQVILVIRAITTESVQEASRRRPRTPVSSDGAVTSVNKNALASPRTSSFRSGRRSVMFGFKGRKDSEAESDHSARPVTSSSLRAKTPDTGLDKHRTKKTATRVTGIAALDITNFLQAEGEADRELTLWSVSHAVRDPESTNGSMHEPAVSQESTLTGSLLGHSRQLEGSTEIAKLKIGFRSLLSPSRDQLVQLRPTLLQGVPITQKIGFAEAPKHPRSDIYISMMEPTMALNGFLSHPRQGSVPMPPESELGSLQLTLEVRNASGDRLDNCIFPFSNRPGLTAWRTVAVGRGESWDQTIRLAIDPEDVPGSHIVMSVADASVGFPFALCWMPLWTQNAFIQDGEHLLALHKYDEETSDMIAGKRAYLGLPWLSKPKDESVTGHMATVKLRTYLCSTKYSQDPVLLGVLKWREQRPRDLMSLLRRYPFVSELEVVKLLYDVLDAFFEMLVHHSGNDEVEDLAFNALVSTLGMVNDHRFDLQPRIDEYTAQRFQSPSAFPCLIRSFRGLLQDPLSSENARKLRATCKVGRKLLRFIVASRKQQIAKEVNIGIADRASSMAKDLQPIFHDMRRIMLSSKPALIGTKTLMVQNFHKWLPELVGALSSSDVLEIATNFIEATSGAQGKMVLYKLLMLKRVTSARLFATEQERIWNMSLFRWIAPYLETPPEMTTQWRDQVRLSCSVVASKRAVYGIWSTEWLAKLAQCYLAVQQDLQPPRHTFATLYPDAYPFPTRPTSSTDHYDECLLELSAIILELANNPNLYPEASNQDILTVLSQLLQVVSSVLDCEAFPASWLTLYLYHHKAALQALQTIYSILIERFLPSEEAAVEDAEAFPTDVWSAWFALLLKLVSSEALFLETFQEQKRRAVWKIAGDVREVGAELLQRSWESIAMEASDEQAESYGLSRMAGFQVQYVPSLVGPVTQLCLGVHEGLRVAAISVLKSMIINEWDLEQDLRAIESAMITCLDSMFKVKGPSDGMLQKHFVGSLLQAFEPYDDGQHEDLITAVRNLVSIIDELLSLLVAVHGAENSREPIHVVDTIRLMDFLKDMQRESMYIGYVHRLSRIQSEASNFTEAGLALSMHADLYDWDHNKIVDEVADPLFPTQTAFERKELLFFEIIKHFEEGQAWHEALAAYSELAQVYANSAFDFAKLARTQRAMATIYERIHHGDTQNPRFFRVIFRGMGFAQGLRGKEFIYEGLPSDRVSSFTDKLLQQYPTARIISGSVEDEIEGQYLTVYPVGPQKNYLHPVNRRLKVAQPIRDHFMLAAPSQFAMSSRRQASTGAVEDQTQRKTVYTTAETFPNMLRRSEIVSAEVIQMSPIQIGLERTTRKTQDLLTLFGRAQEGSEAPLTQLTDTLRSLVKHKSVGSVAEYWRLLPREVDAEDETGSANAAPAALDSTQKALEVALLEHVSTIRRCLAVYAKPAYQTIRAELTREFEATFAPVLEALAEPSDTKDQDSHPWLWNLSSPDPEATVPTAVHKRQSSEAAAGVKEPANPTRFDDLAKNDIIQTLPGIRSNSIKRNEEQHAILLSSRTSVEFENRQNMGEPEGANGSLGKSGAMANGTTPLQDDAPTARTTSLQSRMGSMGRRLSAFGGMSKKGSRDKVRTVESVEE